MNSCAHVHHELVTPKQFCFTEDKKNIIAWKKIRTGRPAAAGRHYWILDDDTCGPNQGLILAWRSAWRGADSASVGPLAHVYGVGQGAKIMQLEPANWTNSTCYRVVVYL